ncbi:MAG TPA: DUF4924 family protein [Mariniphaga sp.]|nr:DUF4924 family protein [Mariniphaga sp.]
MLIAQKKRKENIAEYILYLYQIEDLIRAFHLDMELINTKLVQSYQVDDSTASEISKWYENLVAMMIKEGRQKSSHLQFLYNLVNDLHDFHLRLIADNAEPSYTVTYQSVATLLMELKQKNIQAENDVQVALDGIYGYLLLKIQQKEVSPNTVQAMKQLSSWLSMLSKHYRDFEKGDLQL